MTAGSEDGPMAAGLLAQTLVLLMSLAWSSHRPQLADPLFSLKPLFSKTRREEREGKEREEKGGRRREGKGRERKGKRGRKREQATHTHSHTHALTHTHTFWLLFFFCLFVVKQQRCVVVRVISQKGKRWRTMTMMTRG